MFLEQPANQANAQADGIDVPGGDLEFHGGRLARQFGGRQEGKKIGRPVRGPGARRLVRNCAGRGRPARTADPQPTSGGAWAGI